MSSNLPVRWVPPITPPSPEDRPPRRSGRHGLLIAAAAIAVSTVAAVALMSGGAGSRVAEGPTTGGGNQPYLVTGASATPEKPASTTSEKPATATSDVSATPAAPPPSAARIVEPPASPTAAAPAAGPTPHDGVRVIDLSKKPGEANPSTVARVPVRPATSPASAAPRPAAPPRAASQEATAAPPPVTPAPVPTPVAPTTTATRAAEPAPVPALRQTTDPAAATAASSEPRRRPGTADGASPTSTTGDRGDFADRLATIRRSEEGAVRRAEEPVAPRVLGAPPRWLEAPPSVADEEDTRIVTPPPMREPRRGWRRDWEEDGGPIPPAGIDDEPARPALRSFDPPGRVARDRSRDGENCHFHAYPADDMAFHRDVRCHWHDDARDPSIRYVR